VKLCVVSFKEIWRGPDGQWLTDGGFPYQMAAIAAAYSSTTMVLVQVAPRPNGIPLPLSATVVPLQRPAGHDFRRKVSVLTGLPYYLRTIIREVRRADVVHTPLPGDLAFLGALTAQAFGKRLLARYCGSWVTTSQTTLMNRVTRAWMRRSAGGRSVMLATGHGTVEPAAGMHWIFATALSKQELTETVPELERGLSPIPQLVFVGRLEDGKGLPQLFEALNQLRESGGVQPHLTCIGEGSQRASLEERAKQLGLSVRFTGFLGRDALTDELRRADVCVQPSLSEGFSKAWLDALSAGLPLVASNVGAASYVLGAAGERGWIVPPGDVQSLVETLCEVLTGQHDWPGLRRRCRTFAEEHTLEQWGARISSLCAQQWG